MSASRGRPSPDSPHACAKHLGLKVKGGEYLTWASLVDPAFEAYWARRSVPLRPVQTVEEAA